MVNYQLGKIYKIVCRITGEIYVGSTCEPTLARRLVYHRSRCKAFNLNKKGSGFSSFQIILRGDYYIDLLENFACNSSDELRKKEREYYDIIECINTIRPYQSVEERKADKKRNAKKYKANNRDHINERQRLNYHKNKINSTEEDNEDII